MKQNQDLFEVIKSMDKNEKRYFRMYASFQKGDKNYLKLFDIIDNQKSYDEQAIKTKHKNEKFVKQFAFNKNYLYNLVVKSLVSYHSKSSIDCRIHSIISECKILFRKTLYRQYFNKIDKTKQICLKYERFGYFIQLLDMEKIIIRKEEIQTIKGKQMYEEAISSAEKIKNMFEYSRLSGTLLYNYRSFGTRRDKKQDETISAIRKTKELKNPAMALSARATESYYRVNEIIYDIQADYSRMLDALKMRFKTVNDNPYPFEDYIINYKTDILASLAEAYLKNNNFEECEKYLKIFETIKIADSSDKVDSEIFLNFIRLRLYIKQNQISKAVKLIPLLEEFLIKYKNKILIDIELAIMFNVVKCRILEKNFSKALKSANRLMEHPLLEKRADIEGYLRILNLIIHFELKNYSLLKYLIVSTYRFLYKREKLYKLESVILSFIRKLPEVKNEDDLVYNFISFKKQLEALKKNEYERNAFEYFDFLEWISEKTTSSK